MSSEIRADVATLRKGAIPLPAAVREALGLEDGDLVEVLLDRERLELRIRHLSSVADRTYGALRDRLEPMTDKERRAHAEREIAGNAMMEGR